MKFVKLLVIPSLLLALSGCGQQSAKHHVNHSASQQERVAKQKLTVRKPIMRKANYQKPSEVRPYPKKLTTKDRIVVSIAKQRAYLMHGRRKLYTMYCSTGSHNRTPVGRFEIQSERGKFFYAPKEHEGANYYVSFKDHGVYLFHGTPVNKKHQIMKGVAYDLGKKPSSHGCIHLTIPDARYLSSHAPTGMSVVVKKA